MAIASELSEENLAQCFKRLNITDASSFILPDLAIIRHSSTDQEVVSDNDKQDKLVARLLDLVEQYEQLANESFRSSFMDGFSDLSRAAFNSTRTFGPDSYDMRPYPACKVVEVHGSRISLIDRLEIELRKCEKKKKKELDQVNGETEQNGDNVEPKGPELRDLKKSRSKKTKDSQLDTKEGIFTATSSGADTSASQLNKMDEGTKTEPQKYRNAISQFGGLVPYQLRQAQTHFLSALADSIRLVELQQNISEIIAKISP